MTAHTLPTTTSALRTVFSLAAALTFLSVLMGAIVCATESGFDCPSWPGCYPDQITPIHDINPWIEFTHRAIAIVTGPLILAAAIMGQRSRELPRWVKVLPWVALVTAGAAAAFGMATVLYGIPMWMGVVDMTCALTSMVALGVAAVAARRPGAMWRTGRLATVAWSAVAAMVVMHLSGIAVAGPASLTRCLSWPIWSIVELDGAAAPQVARMAVAGVAVVLVVATAVLAFRTAPAGRAWGVAALVLFGVELAMGALIRDGGLPAEERYAGAGLAFAAVYAATAVLLLRTVIEIAIHSSVAEFAAAERLGGMDASTRRRPPA